MPVLAAANSQAPDRRGCEVEQLVDDAACTTEDVQTGGHGRREEAEHGGVGEAGQVAGDCAADSVVEAHSGWTEVGMATDADYTAMAIMRPGTAVVADMESREQADEGLEEDVLV